MKAARIHEYGAADVIRFDDVPRPSPGPGEVLIKVAAMGHNPSDVWFRSGFLREVIIADFPVTLGVDVSGTIVDTGPDATRFTLGDTVIGRLDNGSGSAAEYVAAPAALLSPAPASIPLAHAAAIPVAGLTAWQAVFEHAAIAPGQRVLINGAGGGVGSFAVALAKHAGATVIATASPRSAEAVARLGADQIIDYTATPLAEALDAPVDILLNCAAVAPEATAALATLVRPGGAIVSAATPIDPPDGSTVTFMHFVARNDADQLAQLVALVESGAVAVDISETRPLDELAEVHRATESGGIRGKVILVP